MPSLRTEGRDDPVAALEWVPLPLVPEVVEGLLLLIGDLAALGLLIVAHVHVVGL